MLYNQNVVVVSDDDEFNESMLNNIVITCTEVDGLYNDNVCKNVGVYEIAAKVSDSNTLFRSETLKENITITKAPIEVIADNKQRVYGENNPEFTFTYNKFLGTDTYTDVNNPKALCQASSKTGVGEYPIVLTSENFSRNYTPKLIDGVLVINKAELTIRAEDKTKFYSKPVPQGTYIAEGFIDGDSIKNLSGNLKYEFKASNSEKAGETYPISVSGVESNNYNITFIDGTVRVKELPVTMRASDISVNGLTLTFNETVAGIKQSEVILTKNGKAVEIKSIAPNATNTGINVKANLTPDSQYDITILKQNYSFNSVKFATSSNSNNDGANNTGNNGQVSSGNNNTNTSSTSSTNSTSSTSRASSTSSTKTTNKQTETDKNTTTNTPNTSNSNNGNVVTLTKIDNNVLSKTIREKLGTESIYGFVDNKGKVVSKPNSKTQIIEIPYTLTEGQNPNNIVVYCIDEKEKIEIVKYCIYNKATAKVSFVGKNNAPYYYAIVSNTKTFEDISNNAWYSNAIDTVTARELFLGIDDKNFAPTNSMTRAMFATVLARLENVNLSSYNTSSFEDVDINSWYGQAIAWAYDKKIISGYSNSSFGPNDNITREQMAVMLNNYLKFKGIVIPKKDSSEAMFNDAKNISSWALEAVANSKRMKLVQGVGENTFLPKNNVTRAEIAQILANLINKFIES